MINIFELRAIFDEFVDFFYGEDDEDVEAVAQRFLELQNDKMEFIHLYRTHGETQINEWLEMCKKKK